MVNWLKLNPHEVEWVVSNLYNQLGFKSVVTSVSKDGGIDVFADYFDHVTENNLKYVIQVKRWKKPVGVKGIRELLGVKKDQKADRATIVSISGYTRPAIEFANRNDIQLVNMGKFEELLGKVNLLKSDGSLSSVSDPNLPQNRMKFVHQILSEARPEGLSSEELVEKILTPRFKVTVGKGLLEQDIDELSSRGEIIEENGRYYSSLSNEEISRVTKDLSLDIQGFKGVFTYKEVYEVLRKKYKVPLPAARRLIPVEETLLHLASTGKISRIVNGVFMLPGSLAKLKKIDWTRDRIQRSILKLLQVSENMLEKSMEDLRVKMEIPEGPVIEFFHKQPLSEMPFMVVDLHFCKGIDSGMIDGVLTLPLFLTPIQAMTPKEREFIKVRIEKKKHPRVITSLGVGIEALEMLKEKAGELNRYGFELVNLIKSFALDKEFEFATRGDYIAIVVTKSFKRKEKFGDVMDTLLDKAEILTKFLVEVYDRCPPPIKPTRPRGKRKRVAEMVPSESGEEKP